MRYTQRENGSLCTKKLRRVGLTPRTRHAYFRCNMNPGRYKRVKRLGLSYARQLEGDHGSSFVFISDDARKQESRRPLFVHELRRDRFYEHSV